MILTQLLPLAISGLLLQQGEHRLEADHAQPTVRSAPDAELRLYEIGHLAGFEHLDALIAEAARNDGRLVGPAEREQLATVENLTALGRSTVESVSNAIRDMLEPAYDESVNSLVPLRRGTLAFVATEDQHAWLARFLEHVSAFDGLVDIQARIYLLAPGELSNLGQGRSGEVLSEARVQTLLQELERMNDGKITAPRVLVYPFQQAELTAVEQHAFIQDFELKIFEDVEIADPVIGIAESGVHLQFRCIPLAGGELSIDAKIDHSTVAQPIPFVERTIGAQGQHVTIQIPEITTIRLNGRFELSPGKTLLMASTEPDGTQEVLVLVQAKRVEAIREEK